MKTKTSRIIVFGILMLSISYFVVMELPFAIRYFNQYHIRYYNYQPSNLASAENFEEPKQEVGVPILMYHGVVSKNDGINTTLPDFIKEMELLKSRGYQTINLDQFEQFREGVFDLPPKPIIITFDDGRKDSYYPTDDVFKKLGFTATIFVATGPYLDGNYFYLGWKDLKNMKESGRWDIQAHGRNSHQFIPINSTNENPGRYLTSLMYLKKEKRLETIPEFEKRVEQDYINNIQDLETNLGIHPKYFAIPLSDYGELPVSNYEDAAAYNNKLIEKYFVLAFKQIPKIPTPEELAKNSDMNIYNFKTTNPYALMRVEVGPMDPEYLLNLLEATAPTSPSIALSKSNFDAPILKDFSTGDYSQTKEGLMLTAKNAGENGQVMFGKTYWENYSVLAHMLRHQGRSVVLIFNFKDPRNYLACGLTDNGYFIREISNGSSQDLQQSYLPKINPTGDITIEASTYNGSASCSFNGFTAFANVPISVTNGAVGFRVWDDKIPARGTLQSLTVEPSHSR